MTVTTPQPSPAFAPPPGPPVPGPVFGPPRPPAPLPVILRAALAGLVAALLVPGQRLGVGTVVAALVVAAAAPPGARVRTPYGAAFGSVGIALLLMAVLRDASWLVPLCLLGALGCWSLLLSGASGWLGSLRGALAVAIGWVPASGWIARALPGLVAADRRTAAAPVARGGLVAALLLLVFGTLFATADAAFGELAGRLVPSAPEMLIWRVPVLIGVVLLVGAAVRVAAARAVSSDTTLYAGRALRPVEWVLPLVVLDLLFAAFVAVQAAVLFGGRTHVLSTADLTYADNARQGFGQLVATAVLTLGVLAVAARVVPRTPANRRTLRLLLGVLCVLTLVVLASASRRLGLYEQEFGFTRLRLSVDGAIYWLAAVLLLVGAAGLTRSTAWLPRAVALSAALGLLLFAVADPDARIADRNVERFQERGDLDQGYAAGLSTDAVPALQELPEPQRSCVLASMGEPTNDGWLEANLSRSRARTSLLERPPGSCPTGDLTRPSR